MTFHQEYCVRVGRQRELVARNLYPDDAKWIARKLKKEYGGEFAVYREPLRELDTLEQFLRRFCQLSEQDIRRDEREKLAEVFETHLREKKLTGEQVANLLRVTSRRRG